MVRLFILFTLLIVSSIKVYGNTTVSENVKAFPAYQIEEVATGLDYPWSLAFLPDGNLLVTEKTGQLRIVNDTAVSAPLVGLPDDIYVKGQGGLLDVVLHPDFKKNNWVYLSYSTGTDSQNALRLVRVKLNGETLSSMQILLTVSPYKSTPVHFAGRMAFLPDNSLLLASGDGFDYREDAQKKDSLLGKILRINDDGSVPSNNPYYAEDTKPQSLESYIFSSGHRNHQAIIYDPVRQLVFSNEHGPDGGDEINIIQAGNNYGWPVITQGTDYSGARISPFTEYPGMLPPLVDWTPSIAPSAMVVYNGNMFKIAKGDLLSTSLKFNQVYWIQMQGEEAVAQRTLFSEIGERLRDIKVHPDGSLYLLTDSANGRILRISSK